MIFIYKVIENLFKAVVAHWSAFLGWISLLLGDLLPFHFPIFIFQAEVQPF